MEEKKRERKREGRREKKKESVRFQGRRREKPLQLKERKYHILWYLLGRIRRDI